jgi:hypothetical protein
LPACAVGDRRVGLDGVHRAGGKGSVVLWFAVDVPGDRMSGAELA